MVLGFQLKNKHETFNKWMGEMTKGRNVQLPTEAEKYFSQRRKSQFFTINSRAAYSFWCKFFNQYNNTISGNYGKILEYYTCKNELVIEIVM